MITIFILFGEMRMKLSDLLPVTSLPLAENRTTPDFRWSPPDTEEAFRKNGGHAVYDGSSITYRLNRHRYRCQEFDDKALVRMVSIGCSYTFGTGLPQEALYHELFADRLRSELKLSVVNWNLGSAAASNNYIARLLHLALPILQPDLVLIFFTHFARREYIAANGQSIMYLPNPLDSDFLLPNPIARNVHSHMSALISKYDDRLSFFRDYKSIESLLAGRLWAFSFRLPEEASEVAGHLDMRHRIRDFKWFDFARDHSHLGPKTHRAIYECFWEWFDQADGPKRIGEIAQTRLSEPLAPK
jgi:hypothetical protein